MKRAALLRLVPVVGLAAGLVACADPSSMAVQSDYRPVYVPQPVLSRPIYSAPIWSPPVSDDLPAYVPPVIERPALGLREPAPAAPVREPDPVPAPVAAVSRPRGVAPGKECGMWRLCNLPGWRYVD